MSNSRFGPGGAKLAHVTTLEPVANTTALYAKADGKLYRKPYGGNEQEIGSGGAVGSGEQFPSSPGIGDLFYKLGEGVYRYNGSGWDIAVIKAPNFTIQPLSNGVVFAIKNSNGDTVLEVDTTTGNLTISGRLICAGVTN